MDNNTNFKFDPSSQYAQCVLAYPDNSADCASYCTADTCPLEWSYWPYRPSLVANGAFAIIFALSFCWFLLSFIFHRRFIGFAVGFLLGNAMEVVGYVGRIRAYSDPFSEGPFLIQICCLTIAPAFMSSGIYLLLSRIITVYGASNSRLEPATYPRIFIPCDVLSLILQGVGGGIASYKTHNSEDPKLGDDIMIAGLAIQVFTLLIFILLSLDFIIRSRRSRRSVDRQVLEDPTHTKLRKSFWFKGFLFATAASTLLIFTRSIYRVAELSQGWRGHLISTQVYFIVLEGALVAAAVVVLNVFNPGFCFKEGYVKKGGKRIFAWMNPREWRRRKHQRKASAVVEKGTMEANARRIIGEEGVSPVLSSRAGLDRKPVPPPKTVTFQDGRLF
ncbi:hypothetical protein LTS18_004039 [Coniosporium uncinatum]|uniref:Uncharacterized protein n=1 Tax=Coniosporium uncinatum TaxID=93489 RepID=A0ACC3D667_9PEZI|nr:hypothetical protein LTS18_004039 [Coniosporium uncinatum]